MAHSTKRKQARFYKASLPHQQELLKARALKREIELQRRIKRMTLKLERDIKQSRLDVFHLAASVAKEFGFELVKVEKQGAVGEAPLGRS